MCLPSPPRAGARFTDATAYRCVRPAPPVRDNLQCACLLPPVRDASQGPQPGSAGSARFGPQVREARGGGGDGHRGHAQGADAFLPAGRALVPRSLHVDPGQGVGEGPGGLAEEGREGGAAFGREGLPRRVAHLSGSGWRLRRGRKRVRSLLGKHASVVHAARVTAPCACAEMGTRRARMYGRGTRGGVGMLRLRTEMPRARDQAPAIRRETIYHYARTHMPHARCLSTEVSNRLRYPVVKVGTRLQTGRSSCCCCCSRCPRGKWYS